MRLRMLASSVLNFTGPLDSEAAPRLQRSLNHWQEGCVLHLLADDPKYADFIELGCSPWVEVTLEGPAP